MFRPNNNFPPAVNPFGSLAAWRTLWRRVFRGTRADASSVLEHVASVPLTTHASVALVRFNDELLLLGITPQGITLLSRGCDEAASAATAGSVRVAGPSCDAGPSPESTAP